MKSTEKNDTLIRQLAGEIAGGQACLKLKTHHEKLRIAIELENFNKPFPNETLEIVGPQMKRLFLILLLSPGMVTAADTLAERDARINRIVQSGGQITFDNRKKDRPPVKLVVTERKHDPRKLRPDIAALETLQNISFRHATDDDLAVFAELPQLIYLSISGEFTDVGMKSLVAAAKLETLVIDSPKVTNDCLPSIGKLPKLTALDLRVRDLDGAGLKLLRPCRELKGLNIAGMKLDGAGLSDLKALPHLEQLALEGKTVNDNSLSLLIQLPELKSLRLRSTAVTDAGLRHIEEMNKLRGLRITGFSSVTSDGVRSLQRKKPRLTISDREE